MPAYNSPADTPGKLDQIRSSRGITALRNTFLQNIKNNPLKAIELINEEVLSFGSLFALRNEIENTHFRPLLNVRHQSALKLATHILNRDSGKVREVLASSGKPAASDILKWMLKSGYQDDSMSKEFDEVLDCSAALLTKTQKDTSSAPIIVDLIFKRHSRGGFIFDLVWALFETSDPGCLYLLAERLRSNHWDDVELARKLLGFIPCIRNNLSMDPEQQYLLTNKWITDNHAFLRYTGESFQQTFDPIPFTVVREMIK